MVPKKIHRKIFLPHIVHSLQKKCTLALMKYPYTKNNRTHVNAATSYVLMTYVSDPKQCFVDVTHKVPAQSVPFYPNITTDKLVQVVRDVFKESFQRQQPSQFVVYPNYWPVERYITGVDPIDNSSTENRRGGSLKEEAPLHTKCVLFKKGSDELV